MAGLTVGAFLYLRRKRPTEEELERERRKMLALSGRLIDGMLLDVREITLEDGRPLTMLEYSYRSAGVDYECSQDITDTPQCGEPRRDARRLPLHRPLPARKPAKQHCDLGVMVRPALEPARIPGHGFVKAQESRAVTP